MITSLNIKDRKKLLFHTLLFSIAVFLSCSVVVSVFHNDDIKHETHPLNHSPVCQWIHEGKLCSRNSTVTDLAANLLSYLSVITALVILTSCFFQTKKHPDKKLPLNFLFLASTLSTRAPPRV